MRKKLFALVIGGIILGGINTAYTQTISQDTDISWLLQNDNKDTPKQGYKKIDIFINEPSDFQMTTSEKLTKMRKRGRYGYRRYLSPIPVKSDEDFINYVIQHNEFPFSKEELCQGDKGREITIITTKADGSSDVITYPAEDFCKQYFHTPYKVINEQKEPKKEEIKPTTYEYETPNPFLEDTKKKTKTDEVENTSHLPTLNSPASITNIEKNNLHQPKSNSLIKGLIALNIALWSFLLFIHFTS
jgi:hypothetical protein